MLCQFCNHENPKYNIFCINCGKKIRGEDNNESVDKKDKVKNPKMEWPGILLWIFFYPLMKMYEIFKNKEYPWYKKLGLIFLLYSLVLPFHIALFYGSLLTIFPPLLVTIMVIGAIVINYLYKDDLKIERENQMIREDYMEREEEEREKHLEEKKRSSLFRDKLNVLFSNKLIKDRLEEFILTYTKDYDIDKITKEKYSGKIRMFIKYLENTIKSGEILGFDENDLYLIYDEKAIKSYINQHKEEIYFSEMKKNLDPDKHILLKDKIREYLNIYGKSGVKELNIKSLSRVLGENYGKLSDLVKKEYNKMLAEYKMERLEKTLFKSRNSKNNLEYIDTLTGFEFEDYLEELFIGLGYESKKLPYSNDYGADLVISKGFDEIVIQAKNYTGSVGNTAVQEVIAAKSHYKSDIAMVITNSEYTQNAIITAEVSDVILVNRNGLEKILEEGDMYFSSLIR